MVNRERLFSNQDLWRLLYPLVITLALTLLVGMVDSVMVSSVGEAAVSGVSLVDTIMQLLIYIFTALATGGAIVAGQYLGNGRKKAARESAEQLIWFSAVFSAAVMILLFMLKEAILNLFFSSITPEVREHANTYLVITAFSIPAIALYEAGAVIFRTMGDSKAAMWISFMMNIMHIAINCILIYGLKMGTAGAAVSTLISRVAAAAAALVLLLNTNRELHITKIFALKPNSRVIRKLLYVGIPNGIENGMFQLGKILVVGIVSSFGTGAIAANSVATTLSAIQVIPGSAISLGMTTVIARCVGNGDYEQAKYYNRLLTTSTYACLLILNLAIYFALPVILPIYNLSPETAELTTQMVLIHTIGTIFIWPLTFNLPASMRAAGDVKFTMVISIASMWTFRIGAAYFLANSWSLGALSVWIAMIIDWLFRAILFGIRWLSGKWKFAKLV